MPNLSKMTAAQLDAYALEKNIDITDAKTKTEKLATIAEADTPDPVRVVVMGIGVDVDQAAFDDFEVLEWLGEAQGGNTFVYPKLIKRLFGDDWERISIDLKGKSAHLSTSRALAFFVEVMQEVGAKN